MSFYYLEFAPFLIFSIIFFLWNYYYTPIRAVATVDELEAVETPNLVCIILLWIFTFYFLMIDLVQPLVSLTMYQGFFRGLLTFVDPATIWNYFEVLPWLLTIGILSKGVEQAG